MSAVDLPALRFATPRETAAEVLAAAREDGQGGLHVLPFNRFDGDSATWWLSPSAEYPAYRHGKIMFTRSPADSPDLFVGLYVEKGIGPGAAQPFLETARGKRYVLDQTWTWHRFTEALGCGEFERLAAAAEEAAGMPVTIVLDAAHVIPPVGRNDDAHRTDVPLDLVRFQLSGGVLRPEGAQVPAGLLRGIGNVTSLAALAAAIGSIPQLDWVWIDFSAGFCFRLCDPGSRNKTWAAAAVWQKACRPWRAWLV